MLAGLRAGRDGAGAAFIKRYFGREWPSRPLYDRMLNSAMAHERAVETIVRSIAVFDDTRAKGMTRRRAEPG